MPQTTRKIKTADIAWCPSYRIVPNKYPSLQIFESISDPHDLEALLEIEAMTDDVTRQMSGRLHLLPADDRIVGRGAGRIMPCFLILDQESASRFSNSEFGAYYAGQELITAISESIFRREKFLIETLQPEQEIDNILILADVQGTMHDIRGKKASYPELYKDSDYTHSQAYARKLRTSASLGIVYDSVRCPGGHCVAVFRPNCISNCRDSYIITYRWDGTKITGHYKKSDFARA